MRLTRQICKWVRIDTNAEDGTPALDDDDEELEDGDEGHEDGEEVVEEGGEEGEDATGKTPAVAPVATPLPPPVDGALAATATMGDVDTVAANGDATETATAAVPATSTPTAIEAADTAVQGPDASKPASTEATPATDAHHIPVEIPSNAIEMSNTAPGATELGLGDLGGESGVETHLVHGESHHAAEEKPVEASEAHDATGDKMDVDEPVASDTEPVKTDSAEIGDATKGEAPETDAGLVMGEMEPDRPELKVDGQDEVLEKEDETAAASGP